MSKNAIIEQGFAMDLAVANIGSIKPVASGTFKDDNGKKIDYDAGVKFKTTNVELQDDEVLGQKEVEVHIWVKIPCAEDSHVKKVNEFLRELKRNGEVLNVQTTLPRQDSGDTYTATSLLKGYELMQAHKVPKTDKKA